MKLRQPSFHYLVHTCEVDFAAAPPRVTEIICTIAGFNSHEYANAFAAQHAKAGADLDTCIIVTSADVEDGILLAFRRGRIAEFDKALPKVCARCSEAHERYACGAVHDVEEDNPNCNPAESGNLLCDLREGGRS